MLENLDAPSIVGLLDLIQRTDSKEHFQKVWSIVFCLRCLLDWIINVYLHCVLINHFDWNTLFWKRKWPDEIATDGFFFFFLYELYLNWYHEI